MPRDEKDVQSVVALLNGWIKPFNGEDKHVSNVSIAVWAAADVHADLLVDCLSRTRRKHLKSSCIRSRLLVNGSTG